MRQVCKDAAFSLNFIVIFVHLCFIMLFLLLLSWMPQYVCEKRLDYIVIIIISSNNSSHYSLLMNRDLPAMVSKLGRPLKKMISKESATAYWTGKFLL